MKKFNTTAVCIPSKHYMVDITERVKEIKKLVDDGKYFTINRARQYGKTTTLDVLGGLLSNEYIVLSLDFQDISNAAFANEGAFVQGMCRIICDTTDFLNALIPEKTYNEFSVLNEKSEDSVKLDEIFRIFARWINESDKPLVLIIDEVDTATNNQVFLDFLAQLRSQYLKREKNVEYKTFQSVILAGVTDVKHLKTKIRPEDEHKVNSPWNIAADFDIDMSLSEAGIRGMLDEYEADHRTGMDTCAIAESIRGYTEGYPYLVSRICQLIDEKMVPEVFESYEEAWTLYGVDEAVKRILQEDNTFFDSVMGKLINMPELKVQLRNILMKGETVAYLPDDEEQRLLRMYGFIMNKHNTVAISNRIFEMRLYNYFIGESRKNDDLKQLAAANKSIFIKEDGEFDLCMIMDHFITEHNRIHGGEDQKFLEQEGRERFLTYLAPIINGTGTYSIEEQTRDHKRMDVVIHYLGKRYVIELKIWRGAKYNEDGEKQVLNYLDFFGLSTGYMLSFSFNKNKETGVREVRFGDKLLYEGVV